MMIEKADMQAQQVAFRESWRVQESLLNLVDELMREQADLSAAERFAQFHDKDAAPLQGRYYSALIPVTAPGLGQQYGFEVDLDRCSGCKACVSACHSLNGLAEDEIWRDVGMLVGGDFSTPVIQHITSACHHCLEPACISACPVDAYEKDPITGIVKHLDDQCFGCQYCTLACPYDVPKFHAQKGIVRKCDMCSERLVALEAPACVQACPHEAIRIQIVAHYEMTERAKAGEFLPCTPSPSLTIPSTTYRSLRPWDLNKLAPADAHQLVPEHAHKPLILMLVLTQFSVGGFFAELIARVIGVEIPGLAPLSLAVGFIGLIASLAHLGRPLFAYRAILGFRHSWLSREVVVFALFSQVSGAYLASRWFQFNHRSVQTLHCFVVMFGIAGILTSIMVYHVVKRPFWSRELGGYQFVGTALVLGIAAALACISIASPMIALVRSSVIAVGASLIAVSGSKLLIGRCLKSNALAAIDSPLQKSASLLDGPLKGFVGLRCFHGIFGGMVCPALAVVAAIGGNRGALIGASILSLLGSLIAEFIERYLFFTAVVKLKMPGGH